MTKNREKKSKNSLLGQNCLNIFEFLTPKKLTKNREKIDFFDSELSKANTESTFRLYQKIDKKIERKSRKIIFGSELFEPNNKPTFR